MSAIKQLGTVPSVFELITCQAELGLCVLQAMGQQSKSEGAVLRFAKCYTPLVVLACVLLIIIPAGMHKSDLKVGLVCPANYSC